MTQILIIVLGKHTNQTADIYIKKCGSIDMDEAMTNTSNNKACNAINTTIN